MTIADSSPTILAHFAALDIWKTHNPQSAIVITGSSARGIQDAFTDIDILAFVPQAVYRSLYEDYRRAVESGHVAALNPKAFQYDEFPLMLISGVAGHYKIERFEVLEEQIAACDDVTMWIHSTSRILHDPTHRYRRIQKRSSTYPESIWKQKVRARYRQAYMAAVAASNPLRRGERATVALTMTDCIAHLLRLCFLLERRPFPYDKWLYAEALHTQPGKDLQDLFASFFAELHQPEIRRQRPEVYERPGHRNADLEEFALYRLWRRATNYFEPRVAAMTFDLF